MNYHTPEATPKSTAIPLFHNKKHPFGRTRLFLSLFLTKPPHFLCKTAFSEGIDIIFGTLQCTIKNVTKT